MSDKLTKIINRTNILALNINFNHEIKKYNFQKMPNVVTWWQEDRYYTMLPALCMAIRAKNVAEIGTMYGGSAVALSKSGAKVTAYDIDFSNIVDEQMFIDKNIKKVLLPDPNACTKIDFKQYDFLYIDIGDHEGKLEKTIHEILVKEKYKGVVAYDDINWAGMVNMWNAIEQPKVSVNWHSSGFGIVLYD